MTKFSRVAPPKDHLNYCQQMDHIQQISMAFCESDAIHSQGEQQVEIKMCMKNILVFPRGVVQQFVNAQGVKVNGGAGSCMCSEREWWHRE